MLDNVCWVGLDSLNQTEFIYAQIVRDELGYGGSLARFNPLANTRQNLMDFMRTRPETMFIVIGSAELAMAKFLVFYKFMESFQVVSKEGLKLLLDFEVKQKAPPAAPEPSPPTRPVSRVKFEIAESPVDTSPASSRND